MKRMNKEEANAARRQLYDLRQKILANTATQIERSLISGWLLTAAEGGCGRLPAPDKRPSNTAQRNFLASVLNELLIARNVSEEARYSFLLKLTRLANRDRLRQYLKDHQTEARQDIQRQPAIERYIATQVPTSMRKQLEKYLALPVNKASQ